MNKKIENIVVKLEKNFKHFDSPNEVFRDLQTLLQLQSDYFSFLGAQNIIVFALLMFSYKKTNGFELGYKLLNDSMFLTVIFSEGTEHRTLCDVCVGESEVECPFCDGTNEVNCPECEGVGEIPCDTCDGVGIDPDSEDGEECYDCNGAGNKTCWACNGNETVNCPECSRGFVNCQECDGIGEVETDDWDYEAETILTWDPQIISGAIETEKTLFPLMSFEDYEKSNNKYILLRYYYDQYLEFKQGFRANQVYCISYDDNPTLSFTNGKLEVQVPWRNLTNYGK